MADTTAHGASNHEQARGLLIAASNERGTSTGTDDVGRVPANDRSAGDRVTAVWQGGTVDLADPYEEARWVQEQAPGWCIWWGPECRRFLAVPPLGANVDRLVEAVSRSELVDRMLEVGQVPFRSRLLDAGRTEVTDYDPWSGHGLPRRFAREALR